MSICKYCKKIIIWESTKDGRRVACEPSTVYYEPDPNGGSKVLDHGEIIQARVRPSGKYVGRVLHRTTCTGKM